MKTRSAAAKATEHRWNTYQSRKRLSAKIDACFAPETLFYIFPLDLKHFKLTPELIKWHWKYDVMIQLQRQLEKHHNPVRLRYIYSLDLRKPETPIMYLLTNAPYEEVQAAYACFMLRGDETTATRIDEIGAQNIAERMTPREYGAEDAKHKKMYVSSRNLTA